MALPPLFPPWFVRVLPSIGMALTVAYVSYKLMEHLQQQQQHQQQQRQPMRSYSSSSSSRGEDEDFEEQLQRALELSLLEHNEELEQELESHEYYVDDNNNDNNNRRVCVWLGLPTETALDDITSHSRLSLCVEILSCLPMALRPVFLKLPVNNNNSSKVVLTDAQLKTILHVLLSLVREEVNEEEEEEEVEEEEEDLDHGNDEYTGKDMRRYRTKSGTEPDERGHSQSTTTTTRTSKTNGSLAAVTSQDMLLVLLTQCSNNNNTSVLLQVLELCPPSDRSTLLHCLYKVWGRTPTTIMSQAAPHSSCSCLWSLLWQQCQGRICHGGDSALYPLVESLVQLQKLQQQQQPQNCHMDQDSVNFDVMQALVDILIRLDDQEHDNESTTTTTTMTTTTTQTKVANDPVGGFLRGLVLCFMNGHEEDGVCNNNQQSNSATPHPSISLIQKLHGLSTERLTQVALCFGRFDNDHVLKFIQTLLRPPVRQVSLQSS